jgi:ankyrin repeat protein
VNQPKLTRSLPAAALLLLSVTADGETPRLVQAVKTGDRATALALARDATAVAAAEADGTTALHWAVRQNDQELVDRLLRTGADASAANRYGVTPLKLAAINGDPKLLGRLLDAGGDANTVGKDGETLLMTAARSGHVDAARLLLERGAEVDAREAWHGQTALMWAAAQGHPAIMFLVAWSNSALVTGFSIGCCGILLHVPFMDRRSASLH